MTDTGSIEVRLPDLGEGIAEAELVRWLVQRGDMVKADQPVAEVMTDKSTVEIPAPVDGVVRMILAEPGSVVPTGTVLLLMDASGTVQAAPSTRKLAADLGVDLGAVTASGPGGRIVREDVERHAASAPPPGAASPAAAPPAAAQPSRRDDGVEIIPLRGLRRQTAHAVAHAWRTVPAITEFRDVDATALIRIRGEMRAGRGAGEPPLTYLPFFVLAVATALRRHPNFNGSIDLERGEITRRTACDIGIATATGDGLIVPVLRRAADLDVDEIAAELDRLIARARAGQLQPAELSGSSVTITNVGSYGTEFGIPIVRASEAAIVAFGRIREAVVAVDGVPAVRALLPLSVAADHRLNDGAELAAFAASIAECVRDPAPRLDP